jgi:alpha-glucosidase
VAAQLDDPRSMLALCRAAVALRPSGPFAWRDGPPGTLAWERESVVSVVNMSGDAIDLPDGELVLASEAFTGRLPPDTAAWVRER